MYRKCCKCNLNNSWNNSTNMNVASEYVDCYEESCSDVQNTLGIYDECSCGFDELSSTWKEIDELKNEANAIGTDMLVGITRDGGKFKSKNDVEFSFAGRV